MSTCRSKCFDTMGRLETDSQVSMSQATRQSIATCVPPCPDSAATSGATILLNSGTVRPPDSTRYVPLGAVLSGGTPLDPTTGTVDFSQSTSFPYDVVLSNLSFQCTATNDPLASITLTLHVAGSNTPLVTSVLNTATQAFDSANSVIVPAWSLIALQMTTTNLPGLYSGTWQSTITVSRV
jgi:hypothetical protein